MPATLTSTQIGSSPDYYKYVSDQVVKTDNMGDPDTLDFTLVGTDAQFVKLNRGAYITASSSLLKDAAGNSVDWFTGYITNDPEYTYLGVNNSDGSPAFSLKYQASSDEIILSQQSLGIVRPFVNMTQGAILSALVERLLPGMFDTTGIQDGLFLAQYVVDPTKNFSDIIKDFSSSAVYRFWGRSKKLFFQPQDASTFPNGSAPFTIDGHDKNFTPSNLTIRATQQSITNDAIVIGATEPQDYITEYFVGDGSTAQFALMNSVFGVESALLLDDDFSDNQLDSTKWTVYDTPTNFLQVSNGYLNVLGGSQNGTFDVHLDSANLIPIAGNLRLTHGDFDFIDAGQPNGVQGVIGGLWTQTPNPALTGCIYGLLVSKSNSVTTIAEIINGVVSTTNVQVVNFSKSYVLRTILAATRINRTHRAFHYFDNTGKVQSVTVPTDPYPDSISFTTHISEIDLVTGQLSPNYPVLWTSTEDFASNQDTFATYTLVASANLNLTVTDTTISTPLQATLEVSPAVVSPSSKATITLTGHVDSTSQIITGEVSFTCNGTNIGSSSVVNGVAILVVQASQVPDGSALSGTFTPSGTTAPGLVTVVASPPSVITFSSATGNYAQEIIGPNEIDGLDGLSPAATITQSGGITQKSTTLGTPKYQAASPTLEFFKNSSTFTTTIPGVGDLARLKYREAGASIARVRDAVSVATEAVNWGDSGIRSVTRSDLSPQPLNSAECEAAAAAIIYEAARTRFEGTYTYYSDYATAEPLGGMTLPFVNLPLSSFEFSEFAEMIYQVKTTLLSISPKETYQYEVSFGKATDQIRVAQVLSRIDAQPNVFAPQDSAEVPTYVAPASIGTAWASDLLYLQISNLAPTTITLTAPFQLPQNCGIEVRSTDSGWGSDNSKNLITRSFAQTFTVPRNSHNKAIFAKMFDQRNNWTWSEDFTQLNTTVVGAPITRIQGTNPDGHLSHFTQFAPNGSFPYVDFLTTTQWGGSLNGCVSMSVKGAPGQTFLLGANYPGFTMASTTIVCNGAWQRLTVPFNFGTGPNGVITFRVQSSGVVSLCHASIELNTSVETVFCKTAGSPYGANSRYASAVRVNLPLVPPPPTSVLSFTQNLDPIVSLTLPQIAMDVWGFEIRAADNSTVLEHQDVANVGVSPSLSMPTVTDRNVQYYCYTYNLLGEYSTPNIVGFPLPTPTITESVIVDATKMLEWSSTDSLGFKVEIALDSGFTQLAVNQTVSDNFFQLADPDFFGARWFRITPFDSLGNGDAVVAEHAYTPDPVVSLGTNEVGVIVGPANSNSNAISVPSNFAKYGSEYSTIAIAMWKTNTT